MMYCTACGSPLRLREDIAAQRLRSIDETTGEVSTTYTYAKCDVFKVNVLV